MPGLVILYISHYNVSSIIYLADKNSVHFRRIIELLHSFIHVYTILHQFHFIIATGLQGITFLGFPALRAIISELVSADDVGE